ncbi:MAG: pyridoxamine 5-phosphate oxidase [Solirubrobacteraceae bacterium]|nr:pyridoxamine 5-phosphate oxidase [Solirubrobacteraceae bacterium]
MADPLGLVADWYAEAVAAGLAEPDAAALATATTNGRPSVRFVLIKGIDADGVRVFTNYESRKGRELAANPRAALAIHWQPLQRQVRLEGPVQRLPAEDSDAYFASRARGSRLGAWASPQGREIPSREWLEARVEEASERFPGEEMERPSYWGGYLLRPDAVELWQGRPSRLHDRRSFVLAADGSWTESRLAP